MCLLSEAGVVERVDVPEEVRDSHQVFLLKVTARPGDVIKRPPHGNTILGFLGTTGRSRAEALAAMNDAAHRIAVTFAA
jgi:hypothetical protein